MTKKGIQRSFQIYLSKLKKASAKTHHNTGSRLLSACKYPKTPSFAVDHDVAATLADVDRFLFENFHSLYICNDDEVSYSPPNYNQRDPPAIRSSERFFVSPGTTSSSLVEEARLSSGSSSGQVVPGDGLPVVTFSKDPYQDFRRSMQDMVEQRHHLRPLDWDFMEELLFCYLELNDRRVHKYILHAFTDLTVSFRRTQGRRCDDDIIFG